MYLLGEKSVFATADDYTASLYGLGHTPTSRLNSLAALYGLGPAPAAPAKPKAPVLPTTKREERIKFWDFSFRGPFLFFEAPKFNWPGLYAICVYDSTWKPLPYRVIYFGEAGNLAERVRASHEKFQEWKIAAGGAFRLYVAFCRIDNAISRGSAERGLIKHYNPECNDQFNSLYGL
jgi:hypothetical protein